MYFIHLQSQASEKINIHLSQKNLSNRHSRLSFWLRFQALNDSPDKNQMKQRYLSTKSSCSVGMQLLFQNMIYLVYHNFNMNAEYGSPSQGPRTEGRRRVITRTESSGFRHPNRQYQLTNNLYSKQNTFMTAVSTGSEHETKSRSRPRSSSSKSLFSAVKLKNYSQARLRLYKKDNFVIPTNNPTKTIQDYNVNPTLEKVLHEKMNRKDKLKIKQESEYSAIRKIVDETSKKVKNRIQETFSIKLEQKKQNLERSCDPMKFNNLVSQFVQTDEQSKLKKSNNQKTRRMLKTQVYSIEVSQPKQKVSFAENPKKAVQEPLEKYFAVKQIKEVKKQKQKQQQSKVKNDRSAVVESYEDQDNIIDKIDLNKQQLKAQPKKVQNQPKKSILEPPPKQKYSDYSQLDDLEDIVLVPKQKLGKDNATESKYNQKQKEKQKEKQRQRQKQKQKQKQRQRQKQRQKQREREKQKQQQKQRKKREQAQQKQKVTAQLTEGNKIIDLMTPIGEVAGYCAQLLKKNKLNWQTPAILLYKECCQRFKKYEDIYIRAAELQIIEGDQKDKFIQDNKVIQKNLQKIVSMGKKKNKLSEKHEQLANSTSFVVLDATIQKQVLLFAKSVIESEEVNNFDVMTCLLRMINGVIILGRLKGYTIDFQEDFEQLGQLSEVKEIVFRGLKLIDSKKLKF